MEYIPDIIDIVQSGLILWLSYVITTLYGDLDRTMTAHNGLADAFMVILEAIEEEDEE
jgi:hypothetical protein|tara:strand:+ start:487 stop:660 length:174 start_codon:yes stop_codon:yes gene_type:complete